MKKLFLLLLLFVPFVSYAQSSAGGGASNGGGGGSGGLGGGTTLTEYVTEKVPGANCVCVKKIESGDKKGQYEPDPTEKSCKSAVYKRLYKCTHGGGLTGFQSLFKEIVRWIINLATILGVLALAALGVAWAIAGDDDPEYKKALKSWVINLIIGLIILFLFHAILRFLAPWIFV